jgi:SAM-dependent methyltransferase
MTDDYRRINRASWDERAPAHAASPDYGFSEFADPAYLSDTVRFDLPRLGDVSGLRGVHLQCHIGTDTVSLARLGARMSGLDFSPAALLEAQKLSVLAGVTIDFHEADVYAADALFGRETFDLVYTGIGALCWLPDVQRWARVVADLLRPGGRLFMREGHPVLFSLDESQAGRLEIGYPYFEHKDPLVLVQAGTYVATPSTFSQNVTHQWNHGIGEIVTALLDAELTLTQLVEHDSVPWDALPGQMTAIGGGEWQLAERPERLPHTFTLEAIKRKPR